MIKEHRKCIFCGRFFPKRDMLRIAKIKNDGLIVDYERKNIGRGCYICFSCISSGNFKKKNMIAKSLKTNVDTKIYNEIERYFKNIIIQSRGGEH
ncbi:protein of unknown function DUF448 [Thermodesulfobium narugense DSM 14796]|uniref:YlxR domain-containing protein n=1 Tax=Thermodesulfobium narugense DSM 14796 TaxID=747365 RepID=M1E6M5_9BACT|nr:YlxR family protein [Thermodesulfobium narugense]AEE14243.1 protein of unknown function DUF448 [Thermodesulfobium narugense DSM 14796]